MLSNSMKFLAVGVSLAGLVACGKGVGEKNNLKVDGAYQEDGITIQGKDVNTSEKSTNLTVHSIDDNIMTTYRFSQDKKGVEVSKKRLIIKGTKVIGTEDIENFCADENELGVNVADIKLKKGGSGLTLTEKGTHAQEKGSDVLLNTKLKALDKAELNANIELAKKTLRACLDQAGNIDVEKSAQFKGKMGIDSVEAEKLAEADAEKEAEATAEAEADAAKIAEEDKATEDGEEAAATEEKVDKKDAEVATVPAQEAKAPLPRATDQGMPQ